MDNRSVATQKSIVVLFSPVIFFMLCAFTQPSRSSESIACSESGMPEYHAGMDARQGKTASPVSDDFNWMVEKVTKNYSGFRDKVRDRTAFDRFTDSLRTQAVLMDTVEKAVPLFESWLRSFKDSHLSIHLKKNPVRTAAKENPIQSMFGVKPLGNHTTLLVLPSFNIQYKRVIDSMVKENDHLLRSTHYLIIDLRNNGGGSDESFGALLPLLYTNPIVTIGADIWSTEDNIRKYESIAADERYSPGTRQAMRELVEKLRRHVGEFVPKDDDDTLRLSSIDALPGQVIIVINGKVGSSAEGFLLKARQSRKVIVAGQPSKGELDYANVYYMDAPSRMLMLGCPTSRSRRLPGMPIDNRGVQPDVVLNPKEEWIDYIAQRVEDFEFSPARIFKFGSPLATKHFQWETTKDTAQVDLLEIAKATDLSENASIMERVRNIVEWTNRNFEWTFTDYKNRTLKEIIVRGGGNCSEQTRITRALLSQLGIKTRSVCEINIQPDDEARQARAEMKVKEVGNKLSVFGLNHNDHVWIEFYDETDQRWKPADPTLGLVGIEAWLIARIGFSPRPTHAILPSRDMIVPIGIFARDDRTGKIVEDRSEFYLLDQFNLAYSRRLEKTKEWADWARLIRTVSPKCREAFEGRSNLHTSTELIHQIKGVYEKMRSASHAAQE